MSQAKGTSRRHALAAVVLLAAVLAACGSNDETPAAVEGVDIATGIEIGQGGPALALVIRSEERPAYFPPVEVQSGVVYVAVIYDVSFSNWPEIVPALRFEDRNERLRHDWERAKSVCVVYAFLEDNDCGAFVADYDPGTGRLMELVKADVAGGGMRVLAGEDLAGWDFKAELEGLLAGCTGDLDARAAANDGWFRGETPASCFEALSALNGSP